MRTCLPRRPLARARQSSSWNSAPRLINLLQHHTECHDPIAAMRKERGEKIVSILLFVLSYQSSTSNPGWTFHAASAHWLARS